VVTPDRERLLGHRRAGLVLYMIDLSLDQG
jgi:hypothetical protein